MEPNWLIWARELQAIAQTGLTYAGGHFDRERYQAIRAIAARMMAEPSGIEAVRIEAVFTEQTGYATPRVGVRAAVFRDDGAILMVREVSDGRWASPGGWADVNQSPLESVEREVREETGFEVVARKLAAVFDRVRHPLAVNFPFHIYKLFFICDIAGGAARPSAETSEVAFFAESEIPEDVSPGRVTRHQISRMFAHARSPELPADFD